MDLYELDNEEKLYCLNVLKQLFSIIMNKRYDEYIEEQNAKAAKTEAKVLTRG